MPRKKKSAASTTTRSWRQRALAIAISLVLVGSLIATALLQQAQRLPLPPELQTVLGEWKRAQGEDRLERLMSESTNPDYQVSEALVAEQMKVIDESRLLSPFVRELSQTYKSTRRQTRRAIARMGVVRARRRGGKLSDEQGLIAEANGPEILPVLLDEILRTHHDAE